jgi:hypothetical protein
MYNPVLADTKKRTHIIEHLALTTDGWTGLSTSYWSLTAQDLDQNFQLHHFKLGCRPVYAPVHTAIVIGNDLKKILEEFGITHDKIAAVVTDEGGAAPLIAGQFSNAEEIHCGAHCLILPYEMPSNKFALRCQSST